MTAAEYRKRTRAIALYAHRLQLAAGVKIRKIIAAHTNRETGRMGMAIVALEIEELIETVTGKIKAAEDKLFLEYYGAAE